MSPGLFLEIVASIFSFIHLPIMAQLLKKTWKEKRIKKSESPLNWNEQKARSQKIKQVSVKNKELREQLKMKKRLYVSELKKRKEQKTAKDEQ